MVMVGLSPRVRGNQLHASRHWGSPRSIPACAGEPYATWWRAGRHPVYPRVCGGTSSWSIGMLWKTGLSPRVRGNPVGAAGGVSVVGSIPACAGEPKRRSLPASAARVYPRVCGGTRTPGAVRPPPLGLSPRVRGNREDRVYPRVCGGTDGTHGISVYIIGLSPRVRGNQVEHPPAMQGVGSIPACAGEPHRGPGPGPSGSVYPRVCGGTSLRFYQRASARGLSPRVRGNLRRLPGRIHSCRSIPACAGEPVRSLCTSPCQKVYPRVCGGTAVRPGTDSGYWGLSPRVRGNPRGSGATLFLLRSIPACAGEPLPSSGVSIIMQVYPRVCGGTLQGCAATPPGFGLSPRVRGNRQRTRRPCGTARSIPACAGEPRRQQFFTERAEVYPRVCGGTCWEPLLTRVQSGLSPRVRGNRHRRPPVLYRPRSIPACAGEPTPPEPSTPAAGGLSPRVRGNLRRGEMPSGFHGSIPACAGEPPDWAASTVWARVYPRVCGGTREGRRHTLTVQGLSPRVRGNHGCLQRNRQPCRSIPACAGEPPPLRRVWHVQSVYPRVCGGTAAS